MIHVSQGLMSHVIEEMCIQLQKAFIKVVTSCESSFAFKYAENWYREEEDSLEKFTFKELHAAADNNAVEEFNEAYTSAVLKRDKVGQELGYHETSQKLNGTEELRSLLDSSERSKKENFTKTVFLFMKPIKTFAGDFDRNHRQ